MREEEEEKAIGKTPLDKRRTIVMLNIEHIFKPLVHANERAMMKIFLFCVDHAEFN